MGRPRNQNRDNAKMIWLKSDGKVTNKKLAEAAGVPESRIRKWKSEDGWKAALDEKKGKRKKGAQPKNANAVGGGAPKQNDNALKHGAFKTIFFSELSAEEITLIESIDLETQTNMLRELQTLIAKENDLKKRIAKYETDTTGDMYIDKIVENLVPKSNKRLENNEKKLEELLIQREDLVWEMESHEKPTNQQQSRLDTLEKQIEGIRDKIAGAEQGNSSAEPFVINNKTVIKVSAFDRANKLRTELDKTHGRIIRLLDSIKAYELESRRLTLEEKKYRLSKQKLNGEFEINPNTGEIDDDYDPEADENEDDIAVDR